MSNAEELAKGINRLQRERAVLLGKIDKLQPAQLDFRPSRQAWSIGQIAHHVALGESVWSGYLKSVLKSAGQSKKATLKVTIDDVPFSSRIIPDFILRNPIVLCSLSLMVNFIPRPVQSMLFAVPLIKMDAGPRMQPRYGMPRAQLLQVLNDTRRETLELVQPVADWDLTRIRIVHPLVGDQDVYGILDLLSSHEQRHSQQIETIRKNTNFPKR